AARGDRREGRGDRTRGRESSKTEGMGHRGRAPHFRDHHCCGGHDMADVAMSPFNVSNMSLSWAAFAACVSAWLRNSCARTMRSFCRSWSHIQLSCWSEPMSFQKKTRYRLATSSW